MSGVNIPTDSTHLSDQAVADMIEQYGGVVDSQFHKKSIMRNFVPIKSVTGTDTIMNRRVGRTSLTTLTAGVRPAATKTNFGSTSLTIDTVVMAPVVCPLSAAARGGRVCRSLSSAFPGVPS